MNSACVQIAASVKHDLGDAELERLLCDCLAHFLCGVRFCELGDLGRYALFNGARGAEGVTLHVVDELSVDVIRTSVHAETRTLCRAAYLFAHSRVTNDSVLIFIYLLNHIATSYLVALLPTFLTTVSFL